jgi:hypothetical protein
MPDKLRCHLRIAEISLVCLLSLFIINLIMDKSDDDETGYGHPPKRSQFVKGRSGNPSGRPKNVPSFRSDLTEELQLLHEIFENGQSLRVTKQRAFIKALIAAAIDNDVRAGAALLACMRHFRVGTDEPPPETVDLHDLEMVEAYLAEQRKRLDLEKATAADRSGSE